MKSGMLEKDIENLVCRYARGEDVTAYKFNSPARAAVPDRLMLAKIPLILRPVIAKYIRFVEMKREGAKPTAAQTREHTRLRALGFTVEVVDNVPDGKIVIDSMGDG